QQHLDPHPAEPEPGTRGAAPRAGGARSRLRPLAGHAPRARRLTVADPLALPSPCVVVLVGPGASGKSTWAAAHFRPDAVISSDRLRALVGTGEDDIAASTDAFAVLDEVVRRRLARRLTTVVDTLGLDAGRRLGWLALAREYGLPCVAVAFDTPAAECRA